MAAATVREAENANKIEFMNSKGAGKLIQKERIKRHSRHRHNPAERVC